MLVLNIGDKLIGDASDSSVVDYTIHGLVGETLNRFADGQLTDTSADLYVAEDIIVITSIVLVNTDSVSRSINLYIQPNGGISRHIVAKDLSLDTGCSLHYDGVKVTIVGPYSGAIGLSDHSKLSNLYYDYSGHTGFASSDALSTVSSTLQTDLDSKAGTLLELADTPIVYYEDKYLRSTASGTEWATVSGGVVVHSDLSNLDYASSGHTGFQPTGDYATDSELTTLSGALKNDIDGKSDITHIHDDRYYTESEVDTISGTLSSEIDFDIATHTSNSDAHHNESHTIISHSDTTVTGANLNELVGAGDTTLHKHDGQYYTEGEVDTISGSLNTKISAKSDTIHTHTESDVTNLDKYTQAEVDTVSGSLQTDIDTKSDTGHIHDDRYYTESEVDGLITTVSGKLDDHNEMNNLDYVSSGHTGFQPAGDYATDSELTTLSGALKNDIDGKSDIAHLHDDRYYTESEVNTISGSLQTDIDGKSDAGHLHDDRYYTESEVDNLITTISGKLDDHDELNNLDYASSGHTGFQPAGDYLTDTEFSTYSGTLQIQIDGKSDSGHAHGDLYYTETELNNGQLDTRYYTETEVDNLITAVSGTTDHSVLDNLDYASSGHTGFQPFGNYATDSELTTLSGALKNDIDGKADTSHLHDDRYYTETELDVGQLDNRYYTESEVDTISGSLQNDIDTHGHVSTEITVEKLNTPTYDTLQEWIDNTQSAGRMSGGDTSTHTDAVTGVTVSGAGYGEFKVAGDQTAGYVVSDPIRVTGSTNNNGYYTVASGVAYSAGTTTIPVDEAVGAVADGNIVNGTVDVTAGTGFIKITDSDIGPTKSFDIHADTNITLTDITTNYVYVDYNGGNPDIKVTADRDTIEWNRQFPLSMIYRNGARTWVCSCGIYLPNKTRLDHERVLTLRGYERATGGEISEYGTRNIQSTAGIFYRGSNEIDTTSKTSVDDKLTTVYYDGAEWVWTENLTQIDNTYYNNIASGLVELGVSKYAVHWICIDYLSNLYVVYGRGSYSLSEAQLAGVPSLMPVVANEFGIVAAKVIIQKTAASFDELISAYTQLIPTATPAVHNNLSGLNDGDYKHLTATEKTKFDGIEESATADQTKADIDGLAITTVGTLDTGNADAIVTKATVGDINTGTEAIKVVTPDTLAGSNLGTKNVVVKCIADDTALTTGNGKAHFTVPIELNGMDLVSVGAHVYTTSSSGIPTFQIYNLTQTADMLTTEITIDETEYDSKDAATTAVIDTNNDDVATGDVLRFDCDVAGTDTTGMEIRTGFRL